MTKSFMEYSLIRKGHKPVLEKPHSSCWQRSQYVGVVYVCFSNRWGCENNRADSPSILPRTRISSVDRLWRDRPWERTIWVLREVWRCNGSRLIGISSLSHKTFHFCGKWPNSASSRWISCELHSLKTNQQYGINQMLVVLLPLFSSSLCPHTHTSLKYNLYKYHSFLKMFAKLGNFIIFSLQAPTLNWWWKKLGCCRVTLS